MVSFLSALFPLLVPILLILIVRPKRRRRIRYSHTFLAPFQDNRLRDFLFRTFQLYYDVLCDVLLAVALALMLSRLLSFTPAKAAVCIDGSYSMLRGQGEAPLERALSLVLDRGLSSKSYRLFLLSFAPGRGRSELFPLPAASKLGSPSQAREALARRFPFFSAEPSALAPLFRQGFSKVIFVTDRFYGPAGDLEVLEVGENRAGFFYPLSAAYDYAAGSFHIRFLRRDFQDPIAVERFVEEEGRYRVFPVAEEAAAGGSLFQLAEEGTYRLSARGLDYLFVLRKPVVRATAVGDFSRLILKALPQLQEGGREVLLADIPYGRGGMGEARKRMRLLEKAPRRIISLLPERQEEESPYLQPLTRTLSQPCYAELPSRLFGPSGEPDILLYQSPRSLQDAQTPLLYLSYLDPETPQASGFRSLPGLRVSRERSGVSSFAYEAGGRILVLNLPPQEFFPLAAREPPVFPRSQGRTWPGFLLLLLLYGAKTFLLYRFHSSGI